MPNKTQNGAKPGTMIHGYQLSANGSARAQFDTPTDNYVYGRDLIAKAGEKPDWQQTLSGRLLTRMVSRGVFGAIAFSYAGAHSGNAMRNYAPKSMETFGEWGKALVNFRSSPRIGHEIKLANGTTYKLQVGDNDPNTYQAIAKFFDVTLGKPTKWVARVLAPEGQAEKWANHSTLFRKRQFFHDPVASFKPGGPMHMRQDARTLGHEMVLVSADFGAMSAADAGARNAVEMLDPNVEKDWFDDKGHFSSYRFAKDMGKRAWRIISFNQGEDWAVAFPYVMFMKWQRNAIDNASPSFKIASDNPHWNGASSKMRRVVGADGKESLEIIGDYQIEGMFDLWGRFGPAYNTLTLLYRETYTSVGKALQNWWDGDSWLPKVHVSERPIADTIDGIGTTGRYLLKSFLKSSIFMTPAVPFFWISRISQSQWRTSPILLENPDMDLPRGVNRIPALSENTPEIVHKGYLDHLVGAGRITRELADDYLLLAKLPKTTWDDLEDNIEKYAKTHRVSEGEIARFREKFSDFKRLHPEGNFIGWNYYAKRYIPGLDRMEAGKPLWFGNKAMHNHPFVDYDPHAIRNATSLFDALTNPFGRVSQVAGEGIYGFLERNAVCGKGLWQWVGPLVGAGEQQAKPLLALKYDGELHGEAHRRLVRDGVRKTVDASIAYTPYVMAKTEGALMWDNKQVDRALNDMIDHTFSFRWSQAKQSAGRVWDLILHPPNIAPQMEMGEKKSGGVRANAPEPGPARQKKQLADIPTTVLQDVSHQSRMNAARMHPEHRTLQ